MAISPSGSSPPVPIFAVGWVGACWWVPREHPAAPHAASFPWKLHLDTESLAVSPQTLEISAVIALVTGLDMKI